MSGQSNLEKAANDAKGELKREIKKQLVGSLVASSVLPSANHHASSNNHFSKFESETVAHFLRKNGYLYSLSVFVAEAKLDPQKSYDEPPLMKQGEASRTAVLSIDGDTREHMKKIAEQLWQRLEAKYQQKMLLNEQKREQKLHNHLHDIRQKADTTLLQKHKQVETDFKAQVDRLNAKEMSLLEGLQAEKLAQKQAIHAQQQDLVEQARELEKRRLKLQELDDELKREIEIHRGRMRHTRETLDGREMALQKKQLRFEEELENTISRMRLEEKEKYAQSLNRLQRREKELQSGFEKLNEKIRELVGVKSHAEDLQQQMEQTKEELRSITEEARRAQDENRSARLKLRDQSDYSALKSEVERLRAELAHVHEQQDRDPKRALLEMEVVSLMEQRILLEKSAALKHEEWKIRLEQERSRFDELARHVKSQSSKMKDMHKELSRLRVAFSDKRQPSVSSYTKGSVKKAVATRFEMPSHVTDQQIKTDDDETPSTPSFVKHAEQRLLKLEQVSKKLDRSLDAYQYTHRQPEQPSASSALIPALQQQVSVINCTASPLLELSHGPPERTSFLNDVAPLTDTVLDIQPPIDSSTPKRNADDDKSVLAVAETKKDDDNDRWLASLKAKEEERRRLDDELRRQQLQLQVEMQSTANSQPPQDGVDEKKTEAAKETEPKLDPIMEKYMEIVRQKREQEHKQVHPKENKMEEQVQSKVDVDEEKIEVASLDKASDSEFDW